MDAGLWHAGHTRSAGVLPLIGLTYAANRVSALPILSSGNDAITPVLMSHQRYPPYVVVPHRQIKAVSRSTPYKTARASALLNPSAGLRRRRTSGPCELTVGRHSPPRPNPASERGVGPDDKSVIREAGSPPGRAATSAPLSDIHPEDECLGDTLRHPFVGEDQRKQEPHVRVRRPEVLHQFSPPPGIELHQHVLGMR